MRQHRVAVVQAGSTLFDTPRTLERMAAHCEEVRREGAELVVFPEAYIGGYPKGLDFGARIGTRTADGRDDYLRYWRSAIELDGPECRMIGGLAADLKANLVVGAIERDGATLHCSVLFFGPDGALLGRRRKLMPTASERLVWGQGDGSTLQVLDTPAGKIGAAICWENYMPLLRQTLHARGVELWCAPTVDDRDIWQCSMRHIAYEGRMFVLSACQYLTRADVPDDHGAFHDLPADAELIGGGSVIVNPMGEIVAGPLRGREGVLAATIDLDDVVRGRYDLDISGHYARPDVFSLHVDTTARASREPR